MPVTKVTGAHPQHREPLKLSGALDHVKYVEVTPSIGRDYKDAKLVDWMTAPNSDELLRDLAITSKSPKHKNTPAFSFAEVRN
jgi:hypothetical protein